MFQRLAFAVLLLGGLALGLAGCSGSNKGDGPKVQDTKLNLKPLAPPPSPGGGQPAGQPKAPGGGAAAQ